MVPSVGIGNGLDVRGGVKEGEESHFDDLGSGVSGEVVS